MSSSSTATEDPVEAQKKADDDKAEAKFDFQLGAFAGVCLIAIVGVIVFLFTFQADITTASNSFQRRVTTNITQIRQLLPIAFKRAENITNKLEAFVTTVFNTVTFSVVQGLTSVTNVILSLGQTLIDTITQSFQFLLFVLSEMGTQALQFFEDAIFPIVYSLQQQGDEVILVLQIAITIFSPIGTLINAITAAVNRIIAALGP